MDISSTRGGRIEIARRSKGLSQTQLRQLIDDKKGISIGSSHWSRIESGKVGLSIELLEAVCGVLDESADWILFGKVEPESRLSPDALEVATIIDSIDEGQRNQIVNFARILKKSNDEHKALEVELSGLMAKITNILHNQK